LKWKQTNKHVFCAINFLPELNNLIYFFSSFYSVKKKKVWQISRLFGPLDSHYYAHMDYDNFFMQKMICFLSSLKRKSWSNIIEHQVCLRANIIHLLSLCSIFHHSSKESDRGIAHTLLLLDIYTETICNKMPLFRRRWHACCHLKKGKKANVFVD